MRAPFAHQMRRHRFESISSIGVPVASPTQIWMCRSKRMVFISSMSSGSEQLQAWSQLFAVLLSLAMSHDRKRRYREFLGRSPRAHSMHQVEWPLQRTGPST